MRTRTAVRPRFSGITLLEILIGIMVLGIGLISLATLFPIGLVRLREAQRQTRSAYLSESSMADMAARNLFATNSFAYADLMNLQVANPPPVWFPNANAPNAPNGYDPLIQDAGFYGLGLYGPYIPYKPSAPALYQGVNAGLISSGGYGLPFAYDPLWRSQTGNYPDPNNALGLNLPEARFAAGNTAAGSTLRADPSDNGLASAHGLQRLTNFNRPTVMGAASQVPYIFVSPEDMVWNEVSQAATTPSPVLPDLTLWWVSAINGVQQPLVTSDWRFTWMVTAQQTDTQNGASFDGNIVVFENRPFAIDNGQVAGETVVEAVYGPSTSVVPSMTAANVGYGAGADRTVLLRWFAIQPDPIVKIGDWIADVTYERSQMLVYSRFYSNNGAGWPNPLDLGEWDNLPAQRCSWYQVQRVTPAQADTALGIPGFRSMTVYVNRTLDAKTLLNSSTGNPAVLNAALICPYVVNVIPQTFFVR
jgi:type II secretory pathway pseudopilin PulG